MFIFDMLWANYYSFVSRDGTGHKILTASLDLISRISPEIRNLGKVFL